MTRYLVYPSPDGRSMVVADTTTGRTETVPVPAGTAARAAPRAVPAHSAIASQMFTAISA